MRIQMASTGSHPVSHPHASIHDTIDNADDNDTISVTSDGDVPWT